MEREIVNTVEAKESGELILILQSGGKPFHQYIYREGVQVCWDDEKKGFQSAVPPREWSYADWFAHTVATVEALDIELVLSPSATWINVPEDIKNELVKIRR